MAAVSDLAAAEGPIAYAGEPGAFGEDAVLAVFGDRPRRPVGSFRDVFAAILDGSSAAGLIPIENLINGTVREAYDLLLEHDVHVIGEVVVPVRLCLAALPGQSLDEIGRVYSHMQALGQAEAFLRTRPWTTLTTYNTAGAGKLIRDAGERGAAAVLSPRAAGLFGLEILADDIQGAIDNRTRFLVVARGAPPDPGGAPEAPESPSVDGRAWRTTLVFSVRNEPGTLLRALQTFADRGVNLSSLESRPSRTAAWEYVFWVDIDAPIKDGACAASITALGAAATMVRVLGSYPRGEAAG